MMFDIPEQYKVQVKIALKDFIPKDLKPEKKKRIKEAIKDVSLAYQIAGEQIPSVMNNEYRCQVIQIYDIEVRNIKEASFIASTYQSIIKSLCVLKIHDAVSEVYSFALKRLSQVDNSQVVILDDECSEVFQTMLPDRQKERFFEYMSFNKIINKTNKVNFYYEMFTKEFMLKNEKAYSNMELILERPVWYDFNRIVRIYSLLKTIVDNKEIISKTTNNVEKIKINQEIKNSLEKLEAEIK